MILRAIFTSSECWVRVTSGAFSTRDLGFSLLERFVCVGGGVLRPRHSPLPRPTAANRCDALSLRMDGISAVQDLLKQSITSLRRDSQMGPPSQAPTTPRTGGDSAMGVSRQVEEYVDEQVLRALEGLPHFMGKGRGEGRHGAETGRARYPQLRTAAGTVQPTVSHQPPASICIIHTGAHPFCDAHQPALFNPSQLP